MVPYLGNTDVRMFWRTCKRYHEMYTPMERLSVVYEKKHNNMRIIDGKRECPKCKLMVLVDRYESHMRRCVSSNQHHLKCELCDSIYMKPQFVPRQWSRPIESDTPHPYISCTYCGVGITSTSCGCLNCKLFCCSFKSCRFCKDTYVSCTKHMCSVDPSTRWYTMLSKINGAVFRVLYERQRLVSSDNRICGKAILNNKGQTSFVYWVFVNVTTYEFNPNIANGRDIFFIVDESSTEIKDSDLLYANYGIAGKIRGAWIKYVK